VLLLNLLMERLEWRDIDGIFFWDWQLVRCSSPKFSLRQRASRKAAGEFPSYFTVHDADQGTLVLWSLPPRKTRNAPFANFQSNLCSDVLFSFERFVSATGHSAVTSYS